MIGFHYLSIKIETYIVSHYYNRDDMTIYEAIHFFMNNMFYSQRQKERILNNFCKIQRIRFLLLKYIKNFRIRKMSIQWYPGHMTKALKKAEEAMAARLVEACDDLESTGKSIAGSV